MRTVRQSATSEFRLLLALGICSGFRPMALEILKAGATDYVFTGRERLLAAFPALGLRFWAMINILLALAA